METLCRYDEVSGKKLPETVRQFPGERQTSFQQGDREREILATNRLATAAFTRLLLLAVISSQSYRAQLSPQSSYSPQLSSQSLDSYS